MTLGVYRNSVRVGSLDMQASEPFYGFTYDDAFLASPTASALSLSLPLADSRYTGTQSLPFFGGLLPEGDAREAIARRLGIPLNSPAKLLRALGQDCAGDITVLASDEAEGFAACGQARAPQYYPYKSSLEILARSPCEEIAQLHEETRLSLAGGQEKIALFHQHGLPTEEGWFIPLQGSPSTHILKPGISEARYPNLTLNEFLCLRAAAVCGITTAQADILFPQSPLLVIRRYDRRELLDGEESLQRVERLHQEDCCQACGVATEAKYEREGGPGFERIRNLLAHHAKQPLEDITAFMRRGLFNYLIGNCDAHAKNYSLLHHGNGTVSLAPAYDLISTAIYDGSYGSKLSRGMAMRIGTHENIDRIDADDFLLFAQSVRIKPAQLREMSTGLTIQICTAFSHACDEATERGFDSAGEVTARILKGAEERIAILESAWRQ